MKNKILTYAIGISVVLHLVGVCVVARGYASRLNAAPETPQVQRLMDVDLVSTPDEATKPKPVAPRVASAPQPEPRIDQPEPLRHEALTDNPRPFDRSTSTLHSNPQRTRPGGNTSRPAGNPGGKLNVGSTSSHGDLGGDWSGGRTPVGWVSGDDHGKGQGSGSGEGVGTPDPPRHVDDGPGERPAPRQDPPPPRMTNVRVCNESGQLPGRYCDRTHSEEFVEGREPSRTCDRCKAPEPRPEPVHVNRLADRSDPLLISDPEPLRKVRVPASVPEDESVTVVVAFTCTRDGDVEGAHVTRSSGYRALDRLVVDAVSHRKYKPAVQNGEPRSVSMSVTCTYN